MPIHDKVMHFAKETPDCIAVSIGGESISYKDLWSNTAALYSFFHDKFSQNKSTTLALIVGNRLEFTEYYLAATMGNHICAVIDPHTPEIQLSAILTQLNPDFIVIDGEHSNVNDVVFNLNYDYIVTRNNVVNDCKTPYSELPIAPIGEFLIGFTSGTTSAPKAYIRSKPAWRKSFELGYDIFQLAEVQKTLCPCPLSHGLGLYCLNEVLYCGSSFYSVSMWNNNDCIELITNEKIDRLVMVPSMVISLDKWLINNNESLNSVTHVVTAGAKLDAKKYSIIRDNFLCASIKEYYGASELGFISVSHLDYDHKDKAINSVGTAFNSVTITIMDDHGNELAEGEIGTIYVNSPLIADGYLWGGDVEFNTNQLATVGDMGYVDSDGYLYVVGRKDGMVLTGGFNVYLSEVETVIKNIPHIIEASVIAMPDDYLGSKLVACTQSESNIMDSLMAACTKALPKYKIPRDFYQLTQWPMTSSGKIKKTELQSMLQNKDVRLVKLPTKQ